MLLQTGVFLKATSFLTQTIFENCIVFIVEYNSNGALGFVINKKFTRPLNELEEFKHSLAFPLYQGGPVDQEHLYFVHKRPDLIEESISIGNGLYFGGKFEQVVACINNYTLAEDHIKIFVGYCGWHTGDLEAEIEEGSWLVVPAADNILFAHN